MITNGPRKQRGGGIKRIRAAALGGGGKFPPFIKGAMKKEKERFEIRGKFEL